MTPPEFSVLLLAWDDADPSVAVLGGAALPPTLPLVYQLAAQQPVLAVYPHLPVSENAGSRSFSKTMAEPAAAEAAVDALATAVDGPGVQVLARLAPGNKAVVPALQSRIIGLTELERAPDADAAVSPVSVAPTAGWAPSPLLVPSRSQWPTGAQVPALAGQWQAPAAPYLGAGSGGFFPPPPRPLVVGHAKNAAVIPASDLSKADGVGSAAPAVSAPTATLRPRQHPQAGDLNFDPDPELPNVQRPMAFDEPTKEMGAAEANDLSAPEDNLVPDEPRPATPQALPSASVSKAPVAEPAAPAVLLPRLEGLNFRMIQYARQAAQLVRGRSDFGVIYAPSWPAWLAALEIRNSSGRPLVLYAASLAADLTNPADHGYQLEMERMTMRRARLILVPTEELRHRLLALYEDALGEVRVVAAADEAAVQYLLAEVAGG